MTKAEIIALAERCEAAEGPNFALELEIFRAINPQATSRSVPPNYTASLDAAMTLVPIDRTAMGDVLRKAMRALGDKFALHMRRWPENENYTEWLARFTTAASLRAIAEEMG